MCPAKSVLLVLTVVSSKRHGRFWQPVSFTSDQIVALINNARREWRCRICLKLRAGWGCTVIELFDRDAPEPSVPIKRILV